MKNIANDFTRILHSIFDLGQDQANHIETINSIEKGVVFRGINVWTLIFAIFVASIGLNVNSTAVIIGAMLISPLMGPIMGLGLSVGIYDFSLFKRSFRNLVLAVTISVVTSALYFFISPLNEVQSELLARTSPTIYDVLIALFGGLAGIVSGSTKEKGTAIPGVAIATALMPPLCTAGFGIATGNLYYFFGAMYLFFINAVMISLSTFIIVRFLKFPLKQEIDEIRSKRIKRYILLVVTITVLPSLYFGWQIINQTIFESNSMKFINSEINFDRTQIIGKKIQYNRSDSNYIEVILAGESLDEKAINYLSSKLKDYSIDNTIFKIKQGAEAIAKVDVNQIKTGIIEEIYKKNELNLANKDKKIEFLENELLKFKTDDYPIDNIFQEAKAINYKIKSFTVNKSIIMHEDKEPDTLLTAYINSKARITTREYSTIEEWLKARLSTDKILIFK